MHSPHVLDAPNVYVGPHWQWFSSYPAFFVGQWFLFPYSCARVSTARSARAEHTHSRAARRSAAGPSAAAARARACARARRSSARSRTRRSRRARRRSPRTRARARSRGFRPRSSTRLRACISPLPSPPCPTARTVAHVIGLAVLGDEAARVVFRNVLRVRAHERLHGGPERGHGLPELARREHEAERLVRPREVRERVARDVARKVRARPASARVS
jgi:hypothetical protein